MKILLRLIFIILIMPYMVLAWTVLPTFHWLRTGENFIDLVNYYVIYIPEKFSREINSIDKGN